MASKASSKIIAQQEPSNGKNNDKFIGVDIGTSKLVMANGVNSHRNYDSQLNAFITVPNSKFTKDILRQNNINHYSMDDSLVVYGDGAEVFANMLNSETRRPMKGGILNPKESNAIEIIKGIIDDLVPEPDKKNIPLCFSIPGAPQGSESSIIYHETIIKRYLEEKGYNAKAINEGLAIVFSELEDENFTGIGISAGGGMCNVCLSFLSVPVFTFSINKGGDYIDDAVASVTGEVNTRVRNIKEEQLDLSRKPENGVEDALSIYYDDLIKSLVESVKTAINHTSNFPQVDKPLPIILSGGTAKPNGFRDRFESYLSKSKFPVDISHVSMAKDPLNATAKGALIAAMYEE